MLAYEVCVENYTTFRSCNSLKLNICKMKHFKIQKLVFCQIQDIKTQQCSENLLKCIRDDFNTVFYIIV